MKYSEIVLFNSFFLKKILKYLTNNERIKFSFISIYFYNYYKYERFEEKEIIDFLSPYSSYSSYSSSSWYSSSFSTTNSIILNSRNILTPTLLLEIYIKNSKERIFNISILSSPGCVVILSCFKNLTHLSLGCLGRSSNRNILDSDITILAINLSSTIKSLQLIKLNLLSYLTLQIITKKFLFLQKLIIFGCDGIRSSYNDLIIEKSKLFSSLLPQIFYPSKNGKHFISFLDLRYSIDLTDFLLQEIQSSFLFIDM